MQKEKPTSELKAQLTQISELVKYARLLGGKIALDGKTITLAELEEMEIQLKARIASATSQKVSRLRIVK